MAMNPEHPIYIVSKGRWHNGLTAKALTRMGVPFKVIVEAHELENYADAVGRERLLVLPQEYLDNYPKHTTHTLSLIHI